MTEIAKIAVIGLGRVGTALSLLLARAGCSLQVCDRNPAAAERLRRMSVAEGLEIKIREDSAAAVVGAGLVMLAVQDRFLAPVAAALAAESEISWSGINVAHLSGSLTAAQVLAPLQKEGAVIFSLHPLQSLADVEGALKVLPGSWFSFEGDDEGLAVASMLVELFGGRMVPLASADKPLYHAAAVVASNFFIVLEDLAIELMSGIGVDRESARQMLLPLIRGSFSNLERQAPEQALTGPIVRGDDATVAGHLAAIAGKFPQHLPAYRLLAGLNVDLARRLGAVKEDDFPSLTAADEQQTV